MTIWSIQSEVAYEVLQSRGVLRCEGIEPDPYFAKAYTWMAEQMDVCLPPPPTRPQFPLWGWWRFDGTERPRPDLRLAGLAPRGEVHYLVEANLEQDELLLSDFELWHFVLNGWDIPVQGSPGRNWEKIFDLDWYEEETTHKPDDKSVQATFWELRQDSVASARRFVAR